MDADRWMPGHLGRLSSFLGIRYGPRELMVGPSLLGRTRWTGSDIARTVAQLGASLRAGGVQPGQTVLVATANRVDLLLHVLALARIGAVPAPASHHLKAGEIAAVAESIGVGAVLADGEVLPRLADVLDAGTPVLVADGRDGGFDVLGHLRTRPHTVPIGPLGDPDDVALYLSTSGTTGRPKAAMLTSRGLLQPYAWLRAMPIGIRRGPRAGRDTLLSALPLAHVMGFAAAVGTLLAGVRWIHLARFEAEAVLDRIEQARVNAFVGVPTMYADLEAAGAARRDLRSMQLWMSAADVMPLDRARRFQSWGGAVRLGGRPLGVAAFADAYGMVELSGPAAVRVLPPAASVRLSMPLPYVPRPGLEVRAVDGAGRPRGWGRTGELAFRGPGVLQGYRNAPGAGPDDAGWFRTGDEGRTWPGGLFTFSGRTRDRLKVSGFSVFPAEVEEALSTAPGLRELCIVGVPDDRTGERVVAVVVAGVGFEREAFLDWSRDRVQGYRRPRALVIVEAIPRGKHDKVDRQAATRLAIAAMGEGDG